MPLTVRYLQRLSLWGFLRARTYRRPHRRRDIRGRRARVDVDTEPNILDSPRSFGLRRLLNRWPRLPRRWPTRFRGVAWRLSPGWR